jgi:hypothetical protein
MCQSHHIHHWTKNGPTDLANLELRCTPCHRKAHEQDDRGPPLARRSTRQADDGEWDEGGGTVWSRLCSSASLAQHLTRASGSRW